MLWLVLLVIIIGYLWWIDALPSSPKAALTNSYNHSSELSVDTFDKYYAGRRNQINLGRLERSRDNEYVIVFNVCMEASKKGKSLIVYKDLPSGPRIYDAFDTLKSNPDKFFNVLSDISIPPVVPTVPVNQSNASNLGLQIENEPTKVSQFAPRKPSSVWKHIERSRGSH